MDEAGRNLLEINQLSSWRCAPDLRPPRRKSSRKWTGAARRTGGVPSEVIALQPHDERFCLFDTAAQRRCFHSQGAGAGVARPYGLTLDPRDLAVHLAQLEAQRAGELLSLSGLPPIEPGIVSHPGYLPGRLAFKPGRFLRSRGGPINRSDAPGGEVLPRTKPSAYRLFTDSDREPVAIGDCQQHRYAVIPSTQKAKPCVSATIANERSVKAGSAGSNLARGKI